MKRFLTSLFAVSLLVSPVLVASAHAEDMHQEAKGHPRIAKAIHEMEDAIAYMEAAPHDFGGHKAAALQATKDALVQLRLALAYRAAVDTKHGK